MRKSLIAKLIYLGLVLCVVASLLVFACAKPAPAPAPTPTPAPKPTPTPAPVTPKLGGTLKILTTYEARNNMGYPPTSVPGWNPFIPSCAVEGLLGKDKEGNPIPRLATGWKYTENGTSLVLTLRQGVKFHDGTDFNADAVKWGLTQQRNTGEAEMSIVSSFEVLDPYTIRINYPKFSFIAVNEFADRAGQSAAVSPTAFQKNGQDWAITNAVGTGPYKQVSFTRDVGVKYVKNPDYWDKGKPLLDGVEWTFILDPVTGTNAFKAGEGDVFTGVATSDAAALAKEGKYVMTYEYFSPFGLASDSANPNSPFYKLEVRQAVSYAIDNKAIADALGYGYWKPANQVSLPGKGSYNPNIVGYPYNPAKAKELLAKAGYPSGFKTSIIFATGIGWESLFTSVQRYLADVGIQAELKPVTTATLQATGQKGWENGLFQASPYMGLGYPPAKTYNFFFSPRTIRYSSSLHPEEIETLLQKALADTDLSVHLKDCQEINRLIIDKYCTYTPLIALPDIAASHPYVKNAEIFEYWREIWNPTGAWLNK